MTAPRQHLLHKYSHCGCPAVRMEDNCAHPDRCAENGRCLQLERHMRECDCGAETTGKWANKHTYGCASLQEDKMDYATLNVVQRVLAAYGSQRDDINDSDLDDEQPLSLNVCLTLGDIRKMRMMVRMQGKNPADFRVRSL